MDMADEFGMELQRGIQNAIKQVLSAGAKQCYKSFCEKRGKGDPTQNAKSPLFDPEGKKGELLYLSFETEDVRDSTFDLIMAEKGVGDKPFFNVKAVTGEDGKPAIAYFKSQETALLSHLKACEENLKKDAENLTKETTKETPEVSRSRVELSDSWSVDREFFDDAYATYLKEVEKADFLGITLPKTASADQFGKAVATALDRGAETVNVRGIEVDVDSFRQHEGIKPKAPTIEQVRKETQKAKEALTKEQSLKGYSTPGKGSVNPAREGYSTATTSAGSVKEAFSTPGLSR